MAAAVLATLIASSFAGDIGPGSPAPALDVKSWLKGTPVKEFDKDKMYVVEFWATWCGPCLQSIPHLTELAKNNKDVTFIGVSIWEDDVNGSVGKFVQNMGDKMDYNVGYSGNKDGMAATWMEPAAQNGIPAAFIIKGGQIMWIGHPMEMEKPLAEIKGGTFNLEAFKTSFNKSADEARKQIAANKEIQAVMAEFTAGHRAAAHKGLDKILAEHPQFKQSAESIKFTWLATEDPKAWEAQAKKIAASKDQNQIQQLMTFAFSESQTDAGAAIARKAMGLALKANPKDFMTNVYAANVYSKTKDYQLALDAINKVLDMYPTSPAKDSAQFKENYEKMKKDVQSKMNKS